MAFQLVRLRTVMLMVPVCPECGFLGPATRAISRLGRIGPARWLAGAMRYS